MNNYQDMYGRYHDKPTNGINQSSNNGWIYTAYAKKVGLTLSTLLEVCFKSCLVKLGKSFALLRNPGDDTPPISRDEILGLAFLKFLKKEHLNGWNFSPYKIPTFNPFKLIKQLYQLRPTLKPLFTGTEPDSKGFLGLYYRHRNYYWRRELDQLYRFAFRVPFGDRHFLLVQFGTFNKFNPLHLFYVAYGKLQSKYKPNGLDWLKYDEKKGINAVCQELPLDHPVVLKI